jgi:hypothetical protein
MIGGLSPDRGWEFFSSPLRPIWLWGPLILLSNGYQGALSLGVKQPGCEADHSPPSSAEVKNSWSCTSALAIRLHGMVLSKKKAQGQLYLFTFWSQSSSDSEMTCHGLYGRLSISVRIRDFSLGHHIENDSGAHRRVMSYPTDT